MKKVILKLAIPNDKARMKAMKAVSTLSGIASIAFDMKEQKLTIVGDADPVALVSVLRKKGHADLVSVGPAKEEEKADKKIPEISYPPHYAYPYPYGYPYPSHILYELE